MYKVNPSNVNNNILNLWVVHYRPNNVSQPWSILDSFDKKVNAIIKAYQVSSSYFMVKVEDPDGNIIWST